MSPPSKLHNAHVNPALTGTDIRNLQINGDPVDANVYGQRKKAPLRHFDFNLPSPETTQPVPKEAYITRVGNEGVAETLLGLRGGRSPRDSSEDYYHGKSIKGHRASS